MNLFGLKKNNEGSKSVAHELLEAERVYRKGVSSLKDLIAPSAMKIESSHVEISGKFARTFFVLAYPRYVSTSWLSPIINMDVAMDISMFLYSMETGVIMKKLRDNEKGLQATISMGKKKGEVRDPMLETAYHDVEELRDRLQQGTERYFRFSLYFTLYAEDLRTLDKISSTLESNLAAKLIVAKRAVLQSESGFNSTLPIGNDELAVAANMNTAPLSTTFPFVS